MKRILFFAILSSFLNYVHAEPYAFHRLFNSEIDETIDLISDYHFLVTDELIQNEQVDSLPTEEQVRFSRSSRALLHALNKLIYTTEEPVSIYFEYNPQDETTIQALDAHEKKIYDSMIMTHAAAHFDRENIPSGKKIIFADSYRTYNNKNIIVAKPNVESYCSSIRDALNIFKKKSLAHDDLKSLQKSTNAKTYAYIKQLWGKYKRETKAYWKEKLQEIQDTKGIQIHDLFTIESQTFKKDTCILDVINFELLFKIFVDQNKHKIIFAGGAHTDYLRNILEKNFGFSCTQFQGLDTRFTQALCPMLMKITVPSLKVQTWDILLNIKQPNIPINFDTYGDLLDTIYNYPSIGDDPAKINMLITQAGEYGIDIERFFLFLCAGKGWINSFKQLFENTTYTNSRNMAGQPVLAIAICNEQIEIIKYLLENNVDIFYIDFFNNNALQLAEQKNNQEIIDLLQACYSSNI